LAPGTHKRRRSIAPGRVALGATISASGARLATLGTKAGG